MKVAVHAALDAATGIARYTRNLLTEFGCGFPDRDVRYTIPFLTQFWLFATPVAYPASLVPE